MKNQDNIRAAATMVSKLLATMVDHSRSHLLEEI
jgi:hypothetical protein